MMTQDPGALGHGLRITDSHLDFPSDQLGPSRPISTNHDVQVLCLDEVSAVVGRHRMHQQRRGHASLALVVTDLSYNSACSAVILTATFTGITQSKKKG